MQRSLAAAGRVQPAFADAAARGGCSSSPPARRGGSISSLQLRCLAGASQRLAIIDADTIDAVQDELLASR